MVIYADILFITNLYIDFFLLACVKHFLHLHVSAWRMLLGAFTGAVCSMTVLLPSGMPAYLSVILGIAAAGFVTLAAFAPVHKKIYLKIAVCYWFSGFLFAGFFMLIYNLFSPKHLAVIRGVVYLNISPAMLFALTLFSYIVLNLMQKIMGPKESALRFCRLQITNQGHTVTVFAKADTGNALCEPFSNLPVIVVEQDAFGATLPDSIVNFWNNPQKEKLRLIPFEGMGGKGILPAFQAKSVTLENKSTPLQCYLAVYDGKLSSGQFQALLNPDLLTEETISLQSPGNQPSAPEAKGSPLR